MIVKNTGSNEVVIKGGSFDERTDLHPTSFMIRSTCYIMPGSRDYASGFRLGRVLSSLAQLGDVSSMVEQRTFNP